MNRLQWKMSSPIGPLYLVASEVGLQGIYWDRQSAPFAKSLSEDTSAVGILDQTVRQLDEYFQGRRQMFELPLNLQGTDFQKRVWQALLKIPYGQTVSYRDIARRIANEKAVRAVGSANGRNPVCIIVPCHRVIAADGSLGGYAGGVDIKAKLLSLEKASLIIK